MGYTCLVGERAAAVHGPARGWGQERGRRGRGGGGEDAVAGGQRPDRGLKTNHHQVTYAFADIFADIFADTCADTFADA